MGVSMSGNIPSILGVYACGGSYGEDGRDFDLFKEAGVSNKEKPHRISVIFGHNGSGKTTIARQIASVARTDGESYFYDADNAKLALDDAELERVRVFDEHYVEKKIRIEDDGLQAIVMLGDQADAKDKIAEIDKKIETTDAEISKLQDQEKALEEGPSSVNQLKSDAINDAKNGGWGKRGQEIKGLNSTMSLTANKWSFILRAATKDPRNEVEGQYRTKLADFQRAQASGSLINVRLASVDYSRDDEKSLIELLGKTLDEPELTERERRILALVQDGRQGIVEMARDEFASEETTICPLCQQEVSQQYRESLEESIIKVLSKEADEYKEKLQAVVLPDIEEEEVPGQVSADVKAAYISACATAKELVGQYRKAVEKRETSLYTPTNEMPHGLVGAVAALNGSVSRLNAEIDAINEAFHNREKMQEELLELSDRIAWLDAHVKIDLHDKAVKALEAVMKRLDELQGTIKSFQSERRQQEARLRQVNIAADVINRYLASVFFDANRFKLVPAGDKYAIQSHGEPVRPKEISTGERNILALCYFFSEGGENKPAGSQDDNPQYIVLDDPVSSFDMENRVGICSLIRERAEHLLRLNSDSRMTVLTHDAGIVTELQHMFDDIKLSSDVNFSIDFFDLTRAGTEPRLMKVPEYTALLKRAYEYASSPNEDSRESMVIGNVLRRILEGYGTFNYGMSMESISRDAELRGRFGNLAPLLGSVMYRLALNDESHMRERLSSLNPPLSFSHYSYEEKKACAQCVFVTLNKLNHEHVRKQLKKVNVSEKDINNKITSWEQRFAEVEKS
jgi:wobble nucleotide-excising tRNase